MDGDRKSSISPDRDGTITAPGMPKTVRTFGKIILIWNTIALVLALVLVILGLAHGANGEILQGAVQGVVAYLFFRCAQGLIRARRRAVWGMTGLCVAVAAWAAVFHRENVLTPFGGIRLGVSVPLLIGALYAPPLVSAFRNWKRFH